jgi:uncharacterized membrane protein
MGSMARTLRSMFLLTSIGWATVLPLTTWVAARAHAPALLYAGAASIYGLGALICHQLPARSFHLWASQMPVCARCVGIYVGAAIASLIARAGTVRHEPRIGRVAIVVAVAPAALTLVYEWWSGQMPANWIRAASGVPIGAMVTALVVAATGDQVN